jgi:hypothetical protein
MSTKAEHDRIERQRRKQLEIETSRWNKLAEAIARILRPAAQE